MLRACPVLRGRGCLPKLVWPIAVDLETPIWVRWASSARLETRTKESNKCASLMVIETKRRTEREVFGLCVKRSLGIAAAQAGAWQLAEHPSFSTHVGTRKVVTYA